MSADHEAHQSSVPFWAVFALDPKSANIVIQAAEREVQPPDENAGYATASNLPDHLRRARLLMEFLEGDQTERDIMLSAAYGFMKAQQAQDEAFSQLDIPYSKENNS